MKIRITPHQIRFRINREEANSFLATETLHCLFEAAPLSLDFVLEITTMLEPAFISDENKKITFKIPKPMFENLLNAQSSKEGVIFVIPDTDKIVSLEIDLKKS